jgi:hypothetical protein
MKILGTNLKHMMALAQQQSQATCPDGSCPFTRMLEQAASALLLKTSGQQYKTADSGSTDGTASSAGGSGSTTGGNGSTTGSTTSPTNGTTPPASNTSGSTAQQVKTRLDQVLAEAFLAPLLAQAAVNVEQKYFLHSPAEQAYAQQMYTQIASQIGTSGRMPLAKGIAKAVLQQMGQSSLWTAQTTGTGQ